MPPNCHPLREPLVHVAAVNVVRLGEQGLQLVVFGGTSLVLGREQAERALVGDDERIGLVAGLTLAGEVAGDVLRGRSAAEGDRAVGATGRADERGDNGDREDADDQIGRASCRERVF